MKAISTLFATLLLAFPAFAQIPNILKNTVLPPASGAQTGARLGYSVGVDGGYVVAGAPDDDTGADGSGVVKVFDSTTGALILVIPNPNPAQGASFGSAVAISGTRIVVGAYLYVTAASRIGIAYVFDLSSATPTVPVLTLNNPSPTNEARFGKAVTILGTKVVVGAPWDSNESYEAGRAYVYDLASPTPQVPVTTLLNPTPVSGESFGSAVALSGNRLIVGTPLAVASVATSPFGTAYIYDLGSATPAVPTLTLSNPNPTNGVQFGGAVAISGTRVVVGASQNDSGGIRDSGNAYVYDLSSATPTVPTVTLNNPSPEQFDYFGWSVGISGTRVVIGANEDNTGGSEAGSAYIYDLSSGTPAVPVLTLNNPTPAAGEEFGNSVAISGSRLVVGTPGDGTVATTAGSAYVYELNGGTPAVPIAILNNPSPAAGDKFGSNVAVSGSLMIVGSPYEDTGATDAGSAYVYDLGSATPTVPKYVLHNPHTIASENFGSRVAISGTRVVVTANTALGGKTSVGTVYVYDLSTATPTVPQLALPDPQAQAGDSFGWSLSISGTRLAVGMADLYSDFAGKVYVYNLTSATPTVPVLTLQHPTHASNVEFGISVGVSGNRIVVGAYEDNTGASAAGRAFVFDVTSATPTVPIVTLNNPTPVANDWFGEHVAISGSLVVVGKRSDDALAQNAGSAYVYDISSATPTVPLVKLNNPAPASGDSFGNSVSISGTRVVVGAFADDAGATDAGSAYVFDMSSATPGVPVGILPNPHPIASDMFATAVAIDGTTVAIGAPLSDLAVVDKGVVYVYGPDTTTLTPTLTAPATGKLSKSPVAVNYTLPEGAAPGSVALKFDNGITARVLHLTGESAGAHAFSFNPANPTAAPDVSSGPAIPDGTYSVVLSYQDALSNPSASATSTNVMIDTTPPTITLLGANPMTVEGGNPYVEPGATANDAIAGNLTGAIQITGAVNVNVVGPYTLNYAVTDPAGNPGTASRLVNVVDTTPPVLTVLGADPAIVEAGMAYTDGGATALDSLAGNLTVAIQVTSNVDTHTPGDYTVNYSVTDGYNIVTAMRAVQVVDTTAPTITHLPDPLTLTADATNHAPAPDLTGQVTATDNVGVISITQDPAPGTILPYGSHTVTFTVEDAAHHTATGTTVLTVADGPALTGRYAGLLSLAPPGNGGGELNGPRANGQFNGPGPVRAFMELKLTRGRFLTGFLRLADGRRVWFPGTILPAATHAETLALNDGTSLALEFDGSGHVAATLTGGQGVLSGEGVLADAGAPAGVPGTYTAILEADGATAPGWLYCVVSKRGAMRISGKLPDGSTINAGQGSIVDRHGDALIFVLGRQPIHPLLTGRAHFENLATSDFSGALAFNDAPCAANGAHFTPAPSGLPAGAYPLTLSGAGIDLTSTVTLLPNNTASVLAPVTTFFPRSKPGQSATGIFYTTFSATVPPTRPLIRGSGIFHQKLDIGSGQFPRAGSVGRIQLGSAP